MPHTRAHPSLAGQGTLPEEWDERVGFAGEKGM